MGVMEEGTSFTDAKGATFTDLTASEDVMEMKEDVSFTDAKGKVFTDEIITFEEDEEESYEEEMSPPSEDEEESYGYKMMLQGKDSCPGGCSDRSPSSIPSSSRNPS